MRDVREKGKEAKGIGICNVHFGKFGTRGMARGRNQEMRGNGESWWMGEGDAGRSKREKKSGGRKKEEMESNLGQVGKGKGYHPPSPH